MTRPALVLAPLLVLATLVPSAHAGCAHLLVDPVGDVATNPAGGALPAPADDGDKIDLLWSELTSTKTTITATLGLLGLNAESQPALDHGYEVSFTANHQRYTLAAYVARTNTWGEVWHQVASTDPDPDAGGASAGEGVGETQVKVDSHRRTVTITAQRSDFDATGGLGSAATIVRAVTYSGLGDPEMQGGTWVGADSGRTDRTYKLGAPGCP